MAFFARVTESLQYWMMYFASCAEIFPLPLSCNPRCVRTKSCRSRFSSRRLICLMTAGGGNIQLLCGLIKTATLGHTEKVSNWGLYIRISTPLTRQVFFVSRLRLSFGFSASLGMSQTHPIFSALGIVQRSSRN